MPISGDRKMNIKIAKTKWPGHFKIINYNLSFCSGELTPGRFGGLPRILI